MLAAMVRGVRLEEAVQQGLVSTAYERDVWNRLQQDVTAIEARGGRVEVPVEPLA